MERKMLDNSVLSGLFGDIAVLASSGMTMEETISMLRDEEPSGALRGALDRLLPVLERGGGLGDAMEESGLFPRYATRMFRAGSDAGRTEEVAASLSRYYDRRAAMARLVSQMLVQPLLLLLLLGAVMGAFVWVVLPVLTGVYRSMGGDAAMYVSGSYIVAAVAFAVIIAALLALLVLWICFKTGRGGGLLRRVWAESSLTRATAELFAEAEFLSDVETRIAGGIMPERAFESACRGLGSDGLGRRAAGCAEKLAQGGSLGTVLYEEKLLPGKYAHIIFSGVKSGATEAALSAVCARLFEEAEARAEGLVRGAEPVLTGFFTLALGISLISVMLPVIGVISAMV